MTQIEKFTKKPVMVEAVFLSHKDYEESRWTAISDWCGGRVHRPAEMDADGWCSGDPVIDIKTSGGMLRVSSGDWIVKDVDGEFHRCSGESFMDSYRKANEDGVWPAYDVDDLPSPCTHGASYDYEPVYWNEYSQDIHCHLCGQIFNPYDLPPAVEARESSIPADGFGIEGLTLNSSWQNGYFVEEPFPGKGKIDKFIKYLIQPTYTFDDGTVIKFNVEFTPGPCSKCGHSDSPFNQE
jgi:hypothetical protein